MNDLFIEVHETRPVIKEKKNDDESVSQEVQLQDNEPVVEKNLIGVSSHFF